MAELSEGLLTNWWGESCIYLDWHQPVEATERSCRRSSSARQGQAENTPPPQGVETCQERGDRRIDFTGVNEEKPPKNES